MPRKPEAQQTKQKGLFGPGTAKSLKELAKSLLTFWLLVLGKALLLEIK